MTSSQRLILDARAFRAGGDANHASRPSIVSAPSRATARAVYFGVRPSVSISPVRWMWNAACTTTSRTVQPVQSDARCHCSGVKPRASATKASDPGAQRELEAFVHGPADAAVPAERDG